MFRNKIGIHITRSFFKLSLLVYRELPNGNYEVLQPGEYKEFNETELVPSTSYIDIVPETGQQLIDQLWNLGYRPSEGISSQGQSKAMEEHIKDLRNITYSLLNINIK